MVKLELAQIEELVVELLTLLFENLVGVFFTAGHTLELREILARWESFFQFNVLVFECLELFADVFK